MTRSIGAHENRRGREAGDLLLKPHPHGLVRILRRISAVRNDNEGPRAEAWRRGDLDVRRAQVEGLPPDDHDVRAAGWEAERGSVQGHESEHLVRVVLRIQAEKEAA